MTNRKYLVTGATGFLGGTICRQLIEQGESVRAFALPNDKAIQFIPEGVEICEGDLCDVEALERFFTVGEGVETIVLHIASIVTVAPDYNPLVMNVNVGGTKNIIKCCLEHKECQKLVYCSSTGAIPETKKGAKIREVRYFDEDQVVGCYSRSKALATQAVLDAANIEGLNACVVHPSGILGPEDFAVGETTKTLIDIVKGAMPMGIDGTFNLCDVRDLAAGTIAAAEKGRKGECYILGNEVVSFRDFSNMLVKEAGCKPVKTVADIMMPNMDGYELVRTLRAYKQDVPVIMLTAKQTFDDKKAGFATGIDDYMTKPVNYEELLWRIEALLRRAKIYAEKKIEIGSVTLSEASYTVQRKNEGGQIEQVQLPKKEFELLYKLLSYPNQIFTKEQLLEEIWGYDTDSDDTTVKTHISRIRNRFAEWQEFSIVTIRGLGYKAEYNSSFPSDSMVEYSHYGKNEG